EVLASLRGPWERVRGPGPPAAPACPQAPSRSGGPVLATSPPAAPALPAALLARRPPLASRPCRAAGRALGRLLPGRAADAVDCTVFAPPAVPRAVPFLVQVFAHTPEQAERAGTLAQEFDESAQRRGFKSLAARVSKGETLSFHLSL